MPIYARTFQAYLNPIDYRFGFDGQEKVDEVSGNGNHNTALFWEYDTRLNRRWNKDPITHSWESPYVVMSNNPIVFIDPLGDEIIGSRKERREFRRQCKVNGTWADIKATYKGRHSPRDLHLRDTKDVNETMASAHIRETPLSGYDRRDKQDYLYYNSHASGGYGEPFAKALKVDPIETIHPNIDVPMPNIVLKIPAFNIVLPPQQIVNFQVNAPFTPGFATFQNPQNGNNQLQQVGKTFLNNPNASQIIITIGTSTVNLNQPSINPNAMTVNQLLWARGRAMQNMLLQMGVPVTAFPQNWLQFAPGTSISTTIQVR